MVPRGIYRSYPGWYISENLFWLSARKRYPMMNGKPLKISFQKVHRKLIHSIITCSLTHYKHDSLPKVFAYYITWLLVIGGQLISLVTFAVWICMSTLFMTLWFTLGLFLFATKVMAIRRVHNWWYYVWTGCRNHDTEIEIDISLLNEALFAEFLFESLPQMVVQSLNNTLTQLWNPIGIFSMCLSVFVMLNGLYRYGYYSFWLGYSIQNVPTEISIGGIKVSIENTDDKDRLKEKDTAKDSVDQGAAVDIESSKPAATQELLVHLKFTEFLRVEVFAMRDSVARYISLSEFDEVGTLFDIVVADIRRIEALFSSFVSVNALKTSGSSSSKHSNEARSSMLLKLTNASDAVTPSTVSGGQGITRLSLFGGSSSAKVAALALNEFSKKSITKAPTASKCRGKKSSDSDSDGNSDSGSDSDDKINLDGPDLRDQQTLQSPELVRLVRAATEVVDDSSDALHPSESTIINYSMNHANVAIDGKDGLRVVAVEEARLAKEAEEERLRIATMEAARLAKEAEEERLRKRDPYCLFTGIVTSSTQQPTSNKKYDKKSSKRK